jgi:hypothetical protein
LGVRRYFADPKHGFQVVPAQPLLHPPLVRLLAVKPPREALLYSNDGPVKLKPEKKRPTNRTGKRVYTDEVIRRLRLVWTFFRYKCGKILAPFMRQQMPFIAS